MQSLFLLGFFILLTFSPVSFFFVNLLILNKLLPALKPLTREPCEHEIYITREMQVHCSILGFIQRRQSVLSCHGIYFSFLGIRDVYNTKFGNCYVSPFPSKQTCTSYKNLSYPNAYVVIKCISIENFLYSIVRKNNVENLNYFCLLRICMCLHTKWGLLIIGKVA